MDPAGIPALHDAIRHLEGCDSHHIETVAVHEQHDGETVWRGDIEVFELIGHPKASRVYAWSEATTGTKRRFFVVLHVPPVASATDAIRASLLADVQRR
jgi:hypothetical protein